MLLVLIILIFSLIHINTVIINLRKDFNIIIIYLIVLVRCNHFLLLFSLLLVILFEIVPFVSHITLTISGILWVILTLYLFLITIELLSLTSLLPSHSLYKGKILLETGSHFHIFFLVIFKLIALSFILNTASATAHQLHVTSSSKVEIISQ